MEAIPEMELASRVESSKSSILNLDQADSEAISISSSILEAAKHDKGKMRNEISRRSVDLASSLLKNKTNADSTIILAQQIESLREMEK